MKFDLAVILFTATTDPAGERASYAHETLRHALSWLAFPDPVRVLVHIADDGSPAGHLENLRAIAKDEGVEAITSTNAEGRGYGASYNLATQVVHSALGPEGIVLALEDDWRAERSIPWRRFKAALLDPETAVGCVRMGYLGWTAPLRGELVASGDREAHDWAQQHYLLFDPWTAEKHVFAGHPRLESVAWERSVGPWPEGLSPQETEVAVCSKPAARVGVAWPLGYDSYHPLFSHIGTVRAR